MDPKLNLALSYTKDRLLTGACLRFLVGDAVVDLMQRENLIRPIRVSGVAWFWFPSVRRPITDDEYVTLTSRGFFRTKPMVS